LCFFTHLDDPNYKNNIFTASVCIVNFFINIIILQRMRCDSYKIQRSIILYTSLKIFNLANSKTLLLVDVTNDLVQIVKSISAAQSFFLLLGFSL